MSLVIVLMQGMVYSFSPILFDLKHFDIISASRWSQNDPVCYSIYSG